MAAKSKKRLSKIENKLLKLEKLQLKDVLCSICQNILVEPVTLPCYHDFCKSCFNGSIENNALCCPLCRLRIGSWLRTATKQKSLVNIDLWNFIKSKFPQEIDNKAKGEDINIPQEKPQHYISKPGEVRSEYEAEIEKLRTERLKLEQKQLQETELLIKKIQQEEEEAHKKYLERLKQDEIYVQQMQKELLKNSAPPDMPKKQSLKGSTTKTKLKSTKIDNYLSKIRPPSIKDSLLTDDNTSTDNSTPKVPSAKPNSRASPEVVPSYGKFLKTYLDKKNKNGSSIWNKENGESIQGKNDDLQLSTKETDKTEDTKVKSKNVQSLPVSLPYTGILQHKINLPDNRNIETGSVDSMRQELCYFKPIEGTTPTSHITSKGLPLRVPGLRIEQNKKSPHFETPPSRAQYIEGLCHLRKLSLANNLPSAFVIALNMLRVKKENPAKCETNTRLKVKKMSSTSPCVASILPAKKIFSNKGKQIDGITKLNNEGSLRRTRSMGSILKDENETTPKKAKDRKVSSERKPYLRSDSKKSNAKKHLNSPPKISESVNNNKLNLVVKNLSSPLKNCDVKKILDEQLRIEKLIEQEKSDFELARKVEAEWNGQRLLRRSAIKRQVTLNYALRPAKKLKV